ncbi:MAG: HD domain-containing protein [Clostridia bacterium]|nr:HD domain-containing protein [Clostridia bacterium]
MSNTYMTVFTVLAVLLTMVDFNYCRQAYLKTGKVAQYLGLSSFAAGTVTASYLASLLAQSYTAMSVASSVYFAAIDWMLVCLVHYAYHFTKMHLNRGARLIRRIICGYALLDSAVMFVNIFSEIAVTFVRPQDNPLGPYVYRMKPLYMLHLAFTYTLVVFVLYLFIRKSTKTPRQYRNQYSLIIAVILMIVVMNAAFLFLQTGSLFSSLDWSVFIYSMGLYLLFWATFSYRQNDMLKSLAMTIFQNIDQGIVLFDYTDELIMCNKKAEQLLSDLPLDEKMTGADFQRKCEIDITEHREDRFTVQRERLGARGQPLRCDFRRLKDRSGGVIGNLFVFTDLTDESDILTGFLRRDTFRRFCAENPYIFGPPTTVTVFDIVGLADVNRTFSREVGDERIRSLAKLIRTHMPKDTYFVRGHEAHLLAVCPHQREADVVDCAQAVISASAGTVLYGMSEVEDSQKERGDLTLIVAKALRSLQVKKLLSFKSFHSQTLATLVRALEEVDSDTEAHVLRTQKMGEMLGRRIGLRDEDLTNLRLLCLLHDIGKIGIPLEILNKPGKLTDQEWAVLRTHAEKGYHIALSSEELKPIALMIRFHHERWDGKGYPDRLPGKEIPILSRVISIVDSYDAMVNTRSYRRALSPEKAQEEIRRCAGTQFDPNLAEKFLQLLAENPEIALGEKTGGEENRGFINRAVFQAIDQGNTFAIPYSRYMLDLEDTIIETDDMFEEITGYARAEVVGRMSQFDLVPSEDKAYYMLQVSNSFARGDIAFLRHELVRKDGERIWVVCHGKRYYDSAEKAFRSEINIFRWPGEKKEYAAPVAE